MTELTGISTSDVLVADTAVMYISGGTESVFDFLFLRRLCIIHDTRGTISNTTITVIMVKNSQQARPIIILEPVKEDSKSLVRNKYLLNVTEK